jgi:hypothetical protein
MPPPETIKTWLRKLKPDDHKPRAGRGKVNKKEFSERFN